MKDRQRTANCAFAHAEQSRQFSMRVNAVDPFLYRVVPCLTGSVADEIIIAETNAVIEKSQQSPRRQIKTGKNSAR